VEEVQDYAHHAQMLQLEIIIQAQDQSTKTTVDSLDVPSAQWELTMQDAVVPALAPVQDAPTPRQETIILGVAH